MRKFMFMVGILLLMTGCHFTSAGSEKVHTMSKPTAEEILAEDHEADIFQYNNVIYINATNIDWVQEKTYDKGAKLSEITRKQDDSTQFIDGTANKLPIGTNVFQTKGNGLLLLMIEKEDKEVIYLGLVEG